MCNVDLRPRRLEHENRYEQYRLGRALQKLFLSATWDVVVPSLKDTWIFMTIIIIVYSHYRWNYF